MIIIKGLPITKMKWYFQFTPQDVHDWDANEVPVLLDLEMEGKQKKLLVQFS